MLSIFKRGGNACKNRSMAAHTMHSNDTHSFVSTEILQKAALDKQNEWENQLIEEIFIILHPTTVRSAAMECVAGVAISEFADFCLFPIFNGAP